PATRPCANEGAKRQTARAGQPPEVHRQRARGPEKICCYFPGRSATPAGGEIPPTLAAGLRPKGRDCPLLALHWAPAAAGFGMNLANQRAAQGYARRALIERGNGP